MNEKELPSGVKFDILKCISNQESSASEIAKKLDISLPYALTQLTILEAQNYLKIQIENNGRQVGKPKKIYSLTENYLQITILGEGFGKRFACNNIDPQMRTFFQFLSLIPDERKSDFSEYFWRHNNYLKNITGMALIEERKNEVELLAITTKEYLHELRQKVSNYRTSQGLKITCWVHTAEEFYEGIGKSDNYYIRLVKEAKPMLDTRGVFEQLGEYKK